MRGQCLDQCIITERYNPDWTKRHHQALMAHFTAGATELVRTETKASLDDSKQNTTGSASLVSNGVGPYRPRGRDAARQDSGDQVQVAH